MIKADKDLNEIIKNEYRGPMPLFDFFPLLRDCLLGLCFMHKNNIVHRDIKPLNILKLYTNEYVISDYGEGINLNDTEKYAGIEY